MIENQMSIFDFPEYLPDDTKKEEPRKPLLNIKDCLYHSGYLCDRYHGGNEYIEHYKKELIKGFACAGCCKFCEQAPMHEGKCKFECRRKNC